jgi:hypothetical protein
MHLIAIHCCCPLKEVIKKNVINIQPEPSTALVEFKSVSLVAEKLSLTTLGLASESASATVVPIP